MQIAIKVSILGLPRACSPTGKQLLVFPIKTSRAQILPL